jgi:hypothetical protein
LKRACSSLFLCALALFGAQSALADDAFLVLRDARTGLGLDGQVTLAPTDATTPPTREAVGAVLAGAPVARSLAVSTRARLGIDQPHALRAEAPGYATLDTVIRPSGDNAGWTLLLDPAVSPPERTPAAPGRLVVEGWVHDASSFGPVADAEVTVEGRSARAFTDDEGRFSLSIDAPRVRQSRPEPLTVRVMRAGYPPRVLRGVLTGAGRLVLQIGLGRLSETIEAHRQSLPEPVFPPAEPTDRRRLDVRGLRADQPPQTITVGYADAGCSQSCCTGSCGHSCVMSLEEYVRRGVDNEWIASWSHDALAAGAVAYRSYGAWHVFNPPAHGAYDICSSACCQVSDASTNARTDEAVAATSGLTLIRDGAVFRSEYSAQNNCLQGSLSCSNGDLSCGDGFAGSPSTGWPCLADPVSAGRDCFGHGRGMSQWGNQYWSEAEPARRWKWQLNHYYNDQGSGTGLRTAVISRVLSVDSVSAPAQPVSPGERIDIALMAGNRAAGTHERVLIGASLKRGGDPFIDDPANDRRVVLPSGPSSTGRPFDLPETMPPGAYDLWLALWIDVDDDGAISSIDLVQDLVVVDSAVQVGGLVFEDRFEN